MPKSAIILMIRHAEKPRRGPGLSSKGKARALAYVKYFQDYVVNSNPIKLDYLFASEDSMKSHRPHRTIKPLADSLGLVSNDTIADKDYEYLVDALQQPEYDGKNILICWHHGEILELAARLLGPGANEIPNDANWPTLPWPPCVYGWVLQLSYDARGQIIPSQTFCKNQELMPDDPGKDPPTFVCPNT